MAEIIQLPDNNGVNTAGMGNIPFSIPIGGFGMGGLGMGGFGGFGGLGGFGGFGMNGIADLFGLAIVASMFGFNGNGGFCGNRGGNCGGGDASAAAAILASQLNSDSGRELVMNAVTAQGEASRTAIQSLSTMLGQDFGAVYSAVQNIQSALCQLASQQGMSTLQVINAIQAGDASLASQLCNCCCNLRSDIAAFKGSSELQICQQTNTLKDAINFVNSSVERGFASTNYETYKQTCELSKAIETNTNRIIEGQRAAEIRDMQAKIDLQADIITQMRNAESNAAQTAQFAAMLAPLQAQLAAIAAKQPNTVPVQWPNIQAVNTTPNVGAGFGWNGFGAGNIVF